MAEAGVPVSYGGSPTPAAGEVLNTQVIPKMAVLGRAAERLLGTRA